MQIPSLFSQHPFNKLHSYYLLTIFKNKKRFLNIYIPKFININNYINNGKKVKMFEFNTTQPLQQCQKNIDNTSIQDMIGLLR